MLVAITTENWTASKSKNKPFYVCS